MLPDADRDPRTSRPDTREAIFRDFLVKALKSPPPGGVRVGEFATACGVGPGVASRVAEDLYRVFALKVAADGIITPRERRKLDGLAATLEVEPGRALEIEQGANDQVYRVAVAEVLADGIVTPEEAAHLANLRISLGIEQDDGLDRVAVDTLVLDLPSRAGHREVEGSAEARASVASEWVQEPEGSVRPIRASRRPWFVVSMDDHGLRYDRVEIRGRPLPDGPALGLIPSTADEVLEDIRRCSRSALGANSVVAVGAFLGGIVVLATLSGAWWAAIGSCGLGLVLVPWLAWHVRVNRTVRIFYEVDGLGLGPRLRDGVVQLFEAWSRVGATWRVGSQAATYDQRRNAGAGTLVSRHLAKVGFGMPPGVLTNVRVGQFGDGVRNIYFLPDRVLSVGPHGAMAVAYDRLNASHRTTRFVESDPVPSDATVVGSTWQFVNKDGSPDRRFNGNRKLPVALYGELDLDGGPMGRWRFQTSRADAAEGIATLVGLMARASSALATAPGRRSAQSLPEGFEPPVGSSPLSVAAGRVASAMSLRWVRGLPDWLQPIVYGLAVTAPAAVLAIVLFGPKAATKVPPAPASPATQAPGPAATAIPDEAIEEVPADSDPALAQEKQAEMGADDVKRAEQDPAYLSLLESARKYEAGYPGVAARYHRDIVAKFPGTPEARVAGGRAAELWAKAYGGQAVPTVAGPPGTILDGSRGNDDGEPCGAPLDDGGICHNRVERGESRCYLHSVMKISSPGAHVGPRGGVYHYSKSGKKVYEKRR